MNRYQIIGIVLTIPFFVMVTVIFDWRLALVLATSILMVGGFILFATNS